MKYNRHCPNCGEPDNGNHYLCPGCGYEFFKKSTEPKQKKHKTNWSWIWCVALGVLFIWIASNIRLVLKFDGITIYPEEYRPSQNAESNIRTTENHVVYDNGEIEISIIGIGDDSISFSVVNGSDIDILFADDNYIVNGASVTGILWMEVPAGTKSTKTLYFDDLDYLEIEEINSFEMPNAEINNLDTYDVIDNFHLSISLRGKLAQSEEYDKIGILLHDSDIISVYVRYRAGEYVYYITNKTDETIIAYADRVSIDNYALDVWTYYSPIFPGTTRAIELEFTSWSLEESDISDYSDLEFIITVLDGESFEEIYSTEKLSFN